MFDEEDILPYPTPSLLSHAHHATPLTSVNVPHGIYVPEGFPLSKSSLLHQNISKGVEKIYSRLNLLSIPNKEML